MSVDWTKPLQTNHEPPLRAEGWRWSYKPNVQMIFGVASDGKSQRAICVDVVVNKHPDADAIGRELAAFLNGE